MRKVMLYFAVMGVLLSSVVNAGWVKVPNPTGPSMVNELYLVNPDTGFAVGGDDIWRTVDGNRSWQKLPRPNAPAVDFLGVYFLNSQEGWVVGSNATTIHTIDGCQTWEVQIWQEPYIHLWAIKPVGDELWSVGAGWGDSKYSGVLFRSL